MIQINPLQSYIDGGARAAITNPPSASLVFDLPGKAIWVKGVKLKGTDHTYTFSHDNYISITNTPDQNNLESEDILIGINTTLLKQAIDTTYGIVNATTNGLAPMFSSANKASATAATTYSFLGIAGTTLKWYQLPWRNVRINTDNTDVLGVTDTDPLIIGSGDGISVTWDSTNKRIVITNSKPHVADNTDFQVSQYVTTTNNDYRVLLKRNANDDDETGTVRYASTLLYNPSTKILKVNGNKVVTFANTYIGATSSANATAGLVPAAASAERLYFLRGDGTWLTIVQENTWRPIKVGTTDALGSGTDTGTLTFVAGTGITLGWDATNKKITITNSAPDQDHNTDRTGIKKDTVSGTKKIDTTLIVANSSSGLIFEGGTNLFKIGDGTNYVEIPVTPSFAIDNKAATIGTSLTTIATIAGVNITAKIGSYAASDHTHTLSIAGDSGTSSISLAASTKYKLTAGGNTYVFTSTPDENVKLVDNNNNENVPILLKNGTGTGTITSSVRTVDGVTINPSANSLSVSGRVKIGSNVNIWSDSEGGNIEIISPFDESTRLKYRFSDNSGTKASNKWEIDAYNGSLRVWTFNQNGSSSSADGYIAPITITRTGDISSAGYIRATSGFIKTDSDDTYVLLGGGGHKALSDFSMAHSHPYLPLAGGTMTGHLMFGLHGTDTYTISGIWVRPNVGLEVETPRISNDASAQILPFNVKTRGGLYAPIYAANIYSNGVLVSVLGHTHDYLPLSGGEMYGNITVKNDYTYSLGSSTKEWAAGYIRELGSRHLDASSVYTSDKSLYIGWGARADTNNIYFYRSATSSGTTSRTLHMTMNSSGFYTSTPFGVNGLNTSYNFYVNGSSYLNGTAYINGHTQINLNISLTGNSANIGFNREVTTGSFYISNSAAYLFHTDSSTFNLLAYNGTYNNLYVFHYNSTTGRVGILKNSPSYNLDVNGSIGGDSILLSGTTPIYFYGVGNGTYNQSVIFCNSNGITLETPRATNASNATVLPLLIRTRGGQGAYVNALGFQCKDHNNNDSVLLAGGSYTALSNLSSSHDHDNRYVLKAGDTMTGLLNINTTTTNALNYKLALSCTGRTHIGQSTNGTMVLDAFDGYCYVGCDSLGGYSNEPRNNNYAFIAINGVNGTTGIGIRLTSHRLYVNGTEFINGDLTLAGNIIANTDMAYSIGNSSKEFKWGFIRETNSRHLDASGVYPNHLLFIGYGSSSVTNIIYFYTSSGSGSSISRSLWAEINSNGLYALTRFGVNGLNTSVNFYVNGTSYLTGHAKMNSISFYSYGCAIGFNRDVTNGYLPDSTHAGYQLLTGYDNNFDLQCYNCAGANSTVLRYNGSNGCLGIKHSSPSYTLHVNGNVGATHYYETSDIRLKHDISSISQSIRKFRFNDDNKLYYGFIAQELEALHPELIDNSGEYKTVNYNSAICYYIAELENKVKTLEERIKILEKIKKD